MNPQLCQVAHRNGGSGINSTPYVETKAWPPLEEDPNVGIEMDGMGVEMLGKLMDGNEFMASVPQIKGPIEKGMDGVGSMVLKEGKIDIIGIPLVPLEYGLDGSSTLD
jgi:hypothetical protein